MKFTKKHAVFVLIPCMLILACLLFAACGADDHSVHIEVELYDGADLLGTADVVNGTEYDLGYAEKTGYSFVGWYGDMNGGSPYTDNKGSSGGLIWKIENPTALFARWEAKKYDVKFDYCGGDEQGQLEKFSTVYDEEITQIFPVPTKRGYVFEGWYTAKDDGIQITNAQGIILNEAKTFNDSVYPLTDEGSVLYAHWSEKKVTFTFSTDGSPVSDVTYAVGTVLKELPLSIKDNYCFTSWCTDPTMIEEVSFPFTVTEDLGDYVTLYADFLPASIDSLQFNSIASTGDKEYRVSCSGDIETIIIPDSYYGKKVTRVTRIDSASVKEIILPQTVKSFEVGAFENCVMLSKINIPSGVTEIPDKCFSGCRLLIGAKLPDGVTSIGKEAFAGCSSIGAFGISAKIEKIGAGAFRNMSSLTTFKVDEENKRYKDIDGVLYYKVGTASYLVQYPAGRADETYAIDESAIKMLEYAFSGSKLTSIEIGGKLQGVPKGAFANCNNLVSVSISSKQSNFKIEDEAFMDCTVLKALKIDMATVPPITKTTFSGVPENFAVYVTSDMIKKYESANVWRNMSEKVYGLDMIFGDFALEEVEGGYAIKQYFGSEKDVTIPTIINTRKIVGVRDGAFAYSNIESAVVPQGIEFVGSEAFKGCKSLKKVILECDPPTLGDDAFENVGEDFAIYIKGSVDLLDSYIGSEEWNEYSEIMWSYQ